MKVRRKVPHEFFYFLVILISNQAFGETQLRENSAYLARVRQLRHREEPISISGENLIRFSRAATSNSSKKSKAKRYRCYLIEEDEESGLLKSSVPTGQKSYFAEFQREREENNRIDNERKRNPVNTRRSEGHMRHSFGPDGKTPAVPTSRKTPIIEYIDYEDASANREPTTPLPKVPNVQIHSKIRRRPLSPADAPEPKESAEREFDGTEKGELEELYSDDLYITTSSTRKPTLQFTNEQGHHSNFVPQRQSKMSKGTAPPKAISHYLQSEELSVTEPPVFKPSAIIPVRNLPPANTFILPREQHIPQQIIPQQIHREIPPMDSAGRPLILSPEHCKMINAYAQLYGLHSAESVISFVHKNCAFAKMYLPSASCAEIDILVSSCFKKT